MVDYKKAGLGAILGIVSILVVVQVTEAANLSGTTAVLVSLIPVALAAKMIYDAFA